MKKLKQSERIENAMSQPHAGTELEIIQTNDSLAIEDPVAKKIFSLIDSADNQTKSVMRTYIAMGKVLLEHKAAVGHGRFRKWFDKHIGPESGNPKSFSYMMGTRYMEIAANEEEALSMEQTSLRKLLVHLKEKKATLKKEKNINEDSPKARRLRAETLRSKKKNGEAITAEESLFVFEYLVEFQKEKETRFSLEMKELQDEIDIFSPDQK